MSDTSEKHYLDTRTTAMLDGDEIVIQQDKRNPTFPRADIYLDKDSLTQFLEFLSQNNILEDYTLSE